MTPEGRNSGSREDVHCYVLNKHVPAATDTHTSDSADILVLKLQCNKRSASTERPTPLLVEEETPFLKHIHV
jgi:hypothetical protein